MGGLHHANGWLFYEVVRVLRASRPKAFLLENVANLADVEEGGQLREIMRCLENPWSGEASTADMGPAYRYDVRYEILDGAAVTPQTRRRLYFIGCRRDAKAPSQTVELEAIVEDAKTRLLMRSATRQYATVKELLMPWPPCRLARWRLTPSQWLAVRRSRSYRRNPRWRIIDVGGNATTLMGRYRISYQLYSEFVPYPEADHELTDAELPPPLENEGHDNDGSSETGGQMGGNSSGSDDLVEAPVRFMTPRECARLQGIPDSFDFLLSADEDGRRSEGKPGRHIVPGSVYKLIGNAVNPIVIEALGGAMASKLF